MKKILSITILAAIVFSACTKKFEKTESGIEYRIINTNDDARAVTKGDQVMLHMVGKLDYNDSLIFDSYKNSKPYYIPSDEPTLGAVLQVLHKGDSAEFSISADSLFLKSFGQPRPAAIKEGSMIKFVVKVEDVYNQEEMRKKISEQNGELRTKDSVACETYLKSLTGVMKTASGLNYLVVKSSTGKQVVKNCKVTVKYKGMLLDGTVFDESKPENPSLSFVVGMGQVIPGWDEGLALMKEGESYKFIIPSNLAYGPQGAGPIPPFSSLIFDVELLKVE